ncbi:S41 family peptidase [Maricaulis sp.]|uniref:S41 family peptidase n=1 Tax=Maricaulis sp. TaxID=1486257 RepID=UPI0032984E3D
MMKVLRLLAGLACLTLPASALAGGTDTIPADAVAADVTEWRDWLFATHPQPGFSMDVEAVNAGFDAVIDGLESDYTQREAWLALSPLNPLFNDGHVAIRLPQEAYEADLAHGAAAFTLPVRLADGRPVVADTIAADSRIQPGETVLAISGTDTRTLVEQALRRTHGDTPGLRAHLVETRFPQYLWALTGGARSWTVTLEAPDGERREVTLDPAIDRATTEPSNWDLAFRDDAAILTLNTFAPTVETEFRAFIDQAFAEIAARGSEILIVDISANGGGAHMLSDHLLAYLTTQRHTPLSAVTARITEQNQALIPGSQLGDVVSMPFAQWVEPPAELANRFTGRTAFLVGAGTYSQAIVLAATVQDFGIAPVAGPGTEGRANSTGQVQLHRLTQTGLEVAAPIYVFIRPSGDTSSAPVIPDIPLEGPREAQIDALIAHLREAATGAD